MSEPTSSPAGSAPSPSEGEAASALLASLVVRQANMAFMLMGKVSHPESGKVVKDMDAARLFIDELEMLEGKTRGNLSKEESAFLKQTLMQLRLAFVEAVDAAPGGSRESASAAPGPAESPKSSAEPAPSGPVEDEHRKKFSKKY